MFGGKVVERQQHVTVLGQAFAGGWILGLVLLQEVAERLVRVFTRGLAGQMPTPTAAPMP